ncbi:MAG: cell division protein ZapA [Andreesenia angusta]|nr:cell division protein ZapA [Andreesenia angusta]
MANRIKVPVRIDGKSINITSTESEEDVLKIAELVDKSIRDILNKNKKLTSEMAYILAAFTIGNKYYKNRAECEEVIKKATEAYEEYSKYKKVAEKSESDIKEKQKQLDQYLKEIEKHQKKIEKQEKEIAELKNNKEEEKLKEDIKNLNKEITKFKRENTRLSKKIDEQEKALEIRTDSLAESEKKIKELQETLFKIKSEASSAEK